MLLEGKKILITGAARGIGQTMALMMADEGADIGLVDRLPEVEETAEAIRGVGSQAEAQIFDISNQDQVKEGDQKIREINNQVTAFSKPLC